MAATQTWITTLPKVGIRPTIDGRYGGVREALEDQVMTMAQSAATLISESLRYPNGDPVECVIADSCIGGVAESSACAEKFDRENIGLTLTVTPSWCYGSETMDMEPARPKAVWGFNGTERPGAVYLAAVLAGHTQKGLPAFGIYGRDVQDAGDTTIPEDVVAKILRFTKAGLAVAMMKGKSYLSMGGCSMGIAGSIVDQDFFEEYLGMRVEAIDLTEFTRRMRDGIYDKVEYEKALTWTKSHCTEGHDPKIQTSMARIYIKRGRWSKRFGAAALSLSVLWGGWHMAFQAPENRRLDRLDALPAELVAERDAIKTISHVDEAKERADTRYQNAMAALNTGDTDAALDTYKSLQSLHNTLASSYTLRVVSQPGERSGVWREPKDNRNAKNYYLIVEAIDSNGKPVTLPVMNEEDGKTYSVEKWGLRVPHSVYQQVAADKQDDGIIQKRRVGIKKSGYLEPEYSISTTGANITSW